MNRVILITGSTRGIGLASAKEFLRNKDSVVIFCRHIDHAKKAQEELAEFDQSSILITTGDVKEGEAAKKIVSLTMKEFGKIDVLINNAGISIWKPIEETSEDEWEDIMHTNLKGAFLFTKEVLPIMKGEKEGIIINVSSGLGVNGAKKYSAYSSSKFGLVGLTAVTTEETKNKGIKCYAVLPGAVATKLHLDIHPWEDPKEMMTPEFVAKKIFEVAEGRLSTGSKIPIN